MTVRNLTEIGPPSSRFAPAFGRVLALGQAPEGIAPSEPFPAVPVTLDCEGRIQVRVLVDRLRAAFPDGWPILVVADRDLTVRGCGPVFGWADRQSGVAVVSTFRLGASGPAAVRARNAIAHEWGHLQGLGHCGHDRCLMRPVTLAAELDNRAAAPCGACPPLDGLRRLGRRIAASLFLALAVGALNYVPGPVVGPAFEAPFT